MKTLPKQTERKKDNTSKRKLKNRKKAEKTKKITQSTTEPESGLFVKGEHKRQFAYEAHTACDKNGFVLETVVTPGNVHDSVAFIELAEDVRHTPKYADLYKLRKEKIERVFADTKEKHTMRYTPYKGPTQVTNRVKLKFAAMNFKKTCKMEMEG